MQRKIKFRAWVKRKNKLMYLRGFRYSGNEKIKITFVDEDKDDCTYTFLNKDVCLEQFTGLHDKNGVEVYEGDKVKIVYDGEEYVYQVVFDISELDFKATNGEENYRNNFQYLSCWEEVEVIGNIHEVKQNET